MVDSFVRADALQCGFCTPGQIVSAVALVDAKPAPTTDEIRHAMAGQPLPLRRVPEDRGGDSHVARLIRTEKEVEGRYEEVWLVVEEDALEQWPAGPRDVVGRPATRDGRARARPRRGDLHRRPAAERDAAHGRAALAARRGARRAASTWRRRSRCRACTPRSGPARSRSSSTTATTRARPSRPSAPTRYAQARARSRRSTSSGRCASRCSIPTRPCARELAPRREPRVRERGDYERGLAEADVVVAGEFRTAGRPAQLDGDAPGGRAVGRRQRRGAHLDAVHLGRPRRGRERPRPAARQGARDLPLHGRRLRLEERRRRLHVHRGRAGASAQDGPSSAR